MRGKSDELSGQASAVAEEVSWLTTLLLVAATLMFTLPAASAIQTGGVEGEMARLGWTALMLFAMMQYVHHLLRYNQIVRQRVDEVYKLLGRGESQG